MTDLTVPVTQADIGWAESAAQHLCHPADRDAAIRLLADAFARHRIAHQPAPVEGDEALVERLALSILDAAPARLESEFLPVDAPMIAHALLPILSQVRADAHREGMKEAANICGTLAETTYDDADGFQAATGCEAAIRTAIEQGAHQDAMKREAGL